jgi:predicted PurR-regulated permease PerM
MTIQNASIIITIVVVSATIIWLKFVLVNLTLAYFVTFLMAPMMDMMEKRPYDGVPKLVLCKNKYADDDWWGHDGESYFEKLDEDYDKEGDWQFPESREGRKRMSQAEWDAAKDRAALEGVNKMVVDLTTSIKIPHMIACIVTLALWVLGVQWTVNLLVGNYEAFTFDERNSACKNSVDELGVDQWKIFNTQYFRVTDDGAGSTAPETIFIKGIETNVPVYPPACFSDCTESIVSPIGADPYADAKVDPEFDYNVAPWEQVDDCRCCSSGNVPSDLLADGTPDKTTGDVSIGFMMTALLNDIIDTLKTDYGVTVYRELICPKKDLSLVNVTARKDGISTVFEFQGVEQLRDQQVSWEAKKDSCYLEKIFPRNKDGQTWAEFSSDIAAVGTMVSDTILVLMLAVFILLERPEGRTIQGDHKVMQKIEDMVKNYISLKTALSALTGLLVAIILELCNVKMGIIFGFLSFLLNFIPSVGSMIAMILPVPIIILDDNVASKSIALLGPAAIQGYVGNVLEPSVFGASLNITAMAVLLGLVFFSATWGLPGAVLSVPLLGGIKIVLHHTDHPLAKYFLVMIREDPTIP